MKKQPYRKLPKILIGLAIVLTLTAFSLHAGLLNGFLIWTAAKVPYEWEISPEHTLVFHDPLWACDNVCPPFIILQTDGGREAGEGQATRIFLHDKDLNRGGSGFERGRFFFCRGRFKKSVPVLVWEFVELRLESALNDPVTGRFFAAEYCENIAPTPEQKSAARKYVEQ